MPGGNEPHNWLAGIASVDITPATGEVIGCFPVKAPTIQRIAEGAHDRLSATALALGENHDGIVICGVDVPMIREDQLAIVRSLVADLDPSIPTDRIILAASHTHHSLDTCYVFGIPPNHPTISALVKQLADVIVRAWHDREPVSLHTGIAHADLSHNRRVMDASGKSIMVFDRQPGVTTGPTDPQAPTWLLQRSDGSPKALLFQFTAHALAIGPTNRVFTADFPGKTRALLAEKIPGVQPLFVNGAAGDVHPHQSMRQDFSAIEKVGTELATAVFNATATLTEQPAMPIRMASRLLKFVNRVDSSLEVSVKIACARVGDWLVASVPGELFVEYQLRFKAALAPRPVLLIGYANGWPGYIPTDQAYREGGYGVDLFTADPPQYSRTALPQGAGEAIFKTLLELADTVGRKEFGS